jgi:hypothetical protein
MLLKFSFFSLFLASFCANSINYSSTLLRLDCPGRGKVEISFHLYGHVSELWQANFEVGAGHTKHGDIEIISFSNGDKLLHTISRDSFHYKYMHNISLTHCKKLSENRVKPSSDI